MAEDVRAISRLTDKQVIDFFSILMKKFEFSEASIRFGGSHEHLTAQKIDKKRLSGPASSKIVYANSHKNIPSVQNPNTQAGIGVIYERGQPVNNGSGSTIIQHSLFIDTIRISGTEHIPASLAIDIHSLIDDHLVSVSAPPLSAPPTTDLQSLVETHHQLITSLSSTLTEIGQEFAAARIKLENETEKRKEQLEQKYSERETELEVRYRENEEKLRSEAERIEKLQKELDYRDNTPVRREIRQQFKKQLESYKEKFSLTADTRKLRIPVHIAAASAVAISVALIVKQLEFGLISSDLWDKILLAVKVGALTFFAGGISIWYLKWLTRWSDRHADTEFHLKQLELDMERASWLVETALEWRNSQGALIPSQLLDALSRNLFVESTQVADQGHSAADQLASAILGEASKVKLNIGGQEIELSRGGLRNLSKPDGK